MRLFILFTLALVSSQAFASAQTCGDLFSSHSKISITEQLAGALREIDANQAAVIPGPISFEKNEIDSIANAVAESNGHGNHTVIRIRDGVVKSRLDSFPKSVQRKIADFTAEIIHQFELQRGMPISDGMIMVRVTSDGADTKIQGFHNHAAPSRSGAVDFVWTLEGPGTILKDGDTTVSAPTGTLVLFGMNVMHGSPNSTARRVLILGDLDP